jgi:16S rRNA (uracil1498-N3)-methyltransferase
MAKVLKRFPVSTPLSKKNSSGVLDNAVYLTREETHHLKNVLRMKEKDSCIVFDGEGNEFAAVIECFLSDGRAKLMLVEKTKLAAPPRLQLSVAQAIPQHRKMDQITREASEIGVFELIPMITEHTVVRMEPEQKAKVVGRWERIAEQTVKQSKFLRTPRICCVITFDEQCSKFNEFDQVFLFHPHVNSKPVRHYIFEDKKRAESDAPKKFLLMIGPEGGFSDHEVAQAQAAGAQLISLGENIYKTDTAFAVASGIFSAMYS